MGTNGIGESPNQQKIVPTLNVILHTGTRKEFSYLKKRLKMKYAEKLKDPRWQKKRLAVLERDGWKCNFCDDKDSTLHVHHKVYNSCDPWDIELDHLLTLCENCHETETKDIKTSIHEFNLSVKKIFTSEKIYELAWQFEDASKRIKVNELSDIINRIFSGPDLLEFLVAHVESEFKDERFKMISTIENT